MSEITTNDDRKAKYLAKKNSIEKVLIESDSDDILNLYPELEQFGMIHAERLA